MIENRELAIDTILELEGGDEYTNRPTDRGGPTKYGITLKALSYARGRDCTPEDVKDLGEEEARQIYLTNYWNAIKGDDLPSGIDLYAMHVAVVSGPGKLAEILQGIVGRGVPGFKFDNFIGKMTIAATRAKRPLDVLFGLNAQWLLYAVRIPGEANDGGWVNRASSMLALAESKIDSNPRLAEANGSKIIKANAPTAVLNGGILAWLATEYGPALLDWFRNDPEAMDRLQSGLAYVGGWQQAILILGAAVLLNMGVNVASAWWRDKQWRKGEV